MKVVILYHPVSEHARVVEEFAREFSRRHPGQHVELLTLEGPEGSTMAITYDIVRYPAVLALQNDGSASQIWQGDSLPLIDEVAGYILN